MPPFLGLVTGVNILRLWPPQQCPKGPYPKFLKKIFSQSQKMVEHKYGQTNRQAEPDKLIWLTSSTEVRMLKYDWLREFWVVTWEPEIFQNVKGP